MVRKSPSFWLEDWQRAHPTLYSDVTLDDFERPLTPVTQFEFYEALAFVLQEKAAKVLEE